MKAKDIMTESPCCCSPDDRLQDVARMMRDNDCGAVPVVEYDRVIGIVTDRDIVVRALANGQFASARIRDVLTSDLSYASADDDVRDVEQIMSDRQVRRVPILNADGRCVGIVSQADLARAVLGGAASEHEVAEVVERISATRPAPFDLGARD